MIRRFRIYLTGFAIGLVMVYFIFGRDDSRDLDMWTPSQRILENIRLDSAFQRSGQLGCFQSCLNLGDSTVLSLWTDAEVKTLTPGGDPYRYLITLRTETRHIEAEVERQGDDQRLVYIKDNQNPVVCECK
ncbi:MAG: hypothetical protein WEC59_11665 [Salibacteraceae bacterium]